MAKGINWFKKEDQFPGGKAQLEMLMAHCAEVATHARTDRIKYPRTNLSVNLADPDLDFRKEFLYPTIVEDRLTQIPGFSHWLDNHWRADGICKRTASCKASSFPSEMAPKVVYHLGGPMVAVEMNLKCSCGSGKGITTEQLKKLPGFVERFKELHGVPVVDGS